MQFGIHINSYKKLLNYLGIKSIYKILDVTQQIAEIDEVILKKDFGDKVSFWGAIDTQKVLPYGTPNEVKEEVRNRIEDLAPRGGYILASCHNIQAGVTPENICTMFETAIEHGEYKKK